MAFEIGDRVIVELEGLENFQIPELNGEREAVGTVVGKPGRVLYNVDLDEPIGEFKTLSHLDEGRLRRPKP